MGIPGGFELLIVFGVVVLLFGAKQLPKLGGAVGESIKNFRKGIKDKDAQALPDNNASTPAKDNNPDAPQE